MNNELPQIRTKLRQKLKIKNKSLYIETIKENKCKYIGLPIMYKIFSYFIFFVCHRIVHTSVLASIYTTSLPTAFFTFIKSNFLIKQYYFFND